MLGDEIKKRVIEHYENSKAPLLLSRFGKSLRVEGLWPVENETRSLREFIEEMKPEVDVIRDPKALAHAIVVAKGHEEIAHLAIKFRHESRFIDNLPRSLVLAFVIKKPDASNIYVQTKTPFKYRITSICDDSEFVIVEDEFRLLETSIESPQDISAEERGQLSERIRKWASKHDIPLDMFYKKDRTPPQPHDNRPGLNQSEQASTIHSFGSALERLQAAQPPGIAERMVIPLDIALALSRLR